jgi:hypothetical protein
VNTADEAARPGVPGGMTPLLYACKSGAEECVSILVRFHADVNAQSSQGESPLDIVIKNGDATAQEVLERKQTMRSVVEASPGPPPSMESQPKSRGALADAASA